MSEENEGVVYKIGPFRIPRILPPKIDPNSIGAHKVDGAQHPVGSNAEILHAKAERERIIKALKKNAALNADDMELARRLGIKLGLDDWDPTRFDL